MNGNHTNNNSMYNQNQILKNLPLKKRRAYIVDLPITNDEQDENYSKTIKKPYSQNDSFAKHIPSSPVVPTPPSSPHMELLHQQYPSVPANSTNIQQQNYLHPSTYGCLMAQKLLAQQFLNNYRALTDQQRSGHTIDDHFRKSLGDNYDKSTDRCLTPDDSSSNSSSIEPTPVDSIEEHFARSLAKFWSLNQDERPSMNRQNTKSVVDDHFSKALGSTTWEKLKEKS